MKSTRTLLLVSFLLVSFSLAQNATPARTDVYHIHFAKAALGKAAEEADYLKAPTPNSPMPGYHLVLRHRDGEDWDYAVIEHLGTKATVEATGTPIPEAMRDLSAWHTDTFVNGPSWPEFAKAMGIDEGSASKTTGSVYAVSLYRAAPGHRDPLEKSLSLSAPGDVASGTVLMQHLEGGPWQYLTVIRYNSWQDYATSQKNGGADANNPSGGWMQVRAHATYHNDTLTDRIAP